MAGAIGEVAIGVADQNRLAGHEDPAEDAFVDPESLAEDAAVDSVAGDDAIGAWVVRLAHGDRGALDAQDLAGVFGDLRQE